MLSMSQQCTIREMYAKGSTVTEIARALSIDRKTVYRYIKQEDFSPKPPVKTAYPSKLDPYRHIIEAWFEEDKKCFHKQRHTYRRVCERLAEEHGFSCPYQTVADYIRKNIRKKGRRESLDLVWEPGEAQADFGDIDCVIDGKQLRCHFLVLCFPYSNMGYAQVFLGETAECFCQGLKDIMEHIGGVPSAIVFDNAPGLGQRKFDQFIEAGLFKRFRAHYRFEARYCSPASGWEKGCAERKVAFLRTELFVPVPVIDDVPGYNSSVLLRCAFQLAEGHYAKHRLQGELFDDDCKRLMSLPRKGFDATRYELAVSDGWGHVTIDGHHVYSSLPEHARTELVVAVGAHDVSVLDRSGEVISRHRRRFGSKRTESIDASSQLRLLTRRPKGWKNSRIRESMPRSVVCHLDSLDAEGLRRDLRLLYDACERSGLDATLDALDILAKEHDDFPDFFQVGVLAARIAGFGLDTPPEGAADLASYDVLFLGGGAHGQ